MMACVDIRDAVGSRRGSLMNWQLMDAGDEHFGKRVGSENRFWSI